MPFGLMPTARKRNESAIPGTPASREMGRNYRRFDMPGMEWEGIRVQPGSPLAPALNYLPFVNNNRPMGMGESTHSRSFAPQQPMGMGESVRARGGGQFGVQPQPTYQAPMAQMSVPSNTPASQPMSFGQSPRDRTAEAYNTYRALSQRPATYGFEAPFGGYNKREQGFMSSVTQANQSDPAGPYSRGMFGLGGPRNPMGQTAVPSPQQQPLQYPQAGTRYSGGTEMYSTPWGTSAGAVAPQFLPGGNAPGDMPILTANQQRATDAINRAGGQFGTAYSSDRVVPKEQNQGFVQNRLPGVPDAVERSMSPEQRQQYVAGAANRRLQHFGLPGVPGLSGQQQSGPDMSQIRTPPSMLVEPGTEGAPTRQQQVVDFFRTNPNATLDHALAAGFTREDVEAAQAGLQTQSLGPMIGPSVMTAGVLPQPVLDWGMQQLGPFGVGPYSPENQSANEQRNRDRERIGGVLGVPQSQPVPQAQPQSQGVTSPFNYLMQRRGRR